MAKGQLRGNREAKKPKQPPKPALPANPFATRPSSVRSGGVGKTKS